jgi:hypothetical protein
LKEGIGILTRSGTCKVDDNTLASTPTARSILIFVVSERATTVCEGDYKHNVG